MARNKYYFSTLFNAQNVPAPKSWLYTDNGTWMNGSPENGTKVICKPTSESASQGISESKIITVSPELSTNLLGSRYIVQEYIEGFECEVPIFKVGNNIHVFRQLVSIFKERVFWMKMLPNKINMVSTN